LAASSRNIGLPFCWNAGDVCRAFCLTLGLILIGNSAIAANDPAITSEQRDGKVEPSGLMTFDLPAQPLISALETYGAVSGLQVVYESALANGSVCGSERRVYTRGALRMLLAGTGLSPRYMAADGGRSGPWPATWIT
jgi:hypothetical protein